MTPVGKPIQFFNLLPTAMKALLTTGAICEALLFSLGSAWAPTWTQTSAPPCAKS